MNQQQVDLRTALSSVSMALTSCVSEVALTSAGCVLALSTLGEDDKWWIVVNGTVILCRRPAADRHSCQGAAAW